MGLFIEREQLLLNTLRFYLSRRQSGYALRQHVYLLLNSLRSIRGARTAYQEGLNHVQSN